MVKLRPIEVPAISFQELKEITKNFDTDCLIGEGSYGRVYYGVFTSGQAVAIKKLDDSKQPNDEFLSQVLLTTLIQVVMFFFFFKKCCYYIYWLIVQTNRFPWFQD